MQRLLWWIMTCLAIAVAGYALVQYFVLDASQAGFVQMKELFLARLGAVWFAMLFIHAASSLIALVIGPFTLSAKFRENNIRLHRIFGKIYVIGVGIGSLSGFYLALYATGGWVGKAGFMTLSILWFTTAYQAFINIKEKRVLAHRKWMIRNYSLTLAAVTLRIWLPLFAWLFGLENFELSYAAIAWFSWVPNIFVAEWFISRKLIKQARLKTTSQIADALESRTTELP
ncbi:DUF2306 domain-containing protein [Sporosarcina sp. FSL W7-1349]|uniref:DUF2306 domain-containing protein n=1 Tax=Sporosarcina sp. FSL W7-1349 TaxID=2921561 RepID=UPI0030FBD84A